MSLNKPNPQPTPSEQQDRSPIIHLSPPKEELPENLEFNQKINPVKITIEVTDADGKKHTDVFETASFILLGNTLYSVKNEENVAALPEVCTTLTHRADIVDLIEKFKYQLYFTSIVKNMAKIIPTGPNTQ